jgi:acetylornithine deacetylase/succinyl-diaminopimelate desuccinylase-like protein
MVTYKEFYAQNRERFIKELSDFISIPSVSTDPERRADMERTAKWCIDKLQSIGLEDVKVIKPSAKEYEDGYGAVVGQKIFDEKLPTLMVYGHYDVQPPDPLDQWLTDPFTPTIVNDVLFARGATDNKGQLFTNIIGLEYYIKHVENKRFNVKVFIEGEEEISGPTTEVILQSHEFDNEIKADFLYVSDGPWNSADMPSIEYSLRGIIYYDLHIKVSEMDMHSGLYGNAVLNPGNLAAYFVYKMKDIKKNRIRVPNFYKSVRKPGEEEIQMLREVSPSWDEIKSATTATAVTPYRRKGEEFSTLALTGLRPSFDVHGIHLGFTEPGGQKTIIPREALVKFSLRLVADQTVKESQALVRKYVEKIMPKGVVWELREMGTSEPFLTDPNHPEIKKAQAALEKGFGKRAVLTPSGGSIGITNTFKHEYGMTALLVNYGLPDDRLHAPNEKYNLSQLEGGFYSFVEYLMNK